MRPSRGTPWLQRRQRGPLPRASESGAGPARERWLWSSAQAAPVQEGTIGQSPRACSQSNSQLAATLGAGFPRHRSRSPCRKARRITVAFDDHTCCPWRPRSGCRPRQVSGARRSALGRRSVGVAAGACVSIWSIESLRVLAGHCGYNGAIAAPVTTQGGSS
jgi:hypothetical protein